MLKILPAIAFSVVALSIPKVEAIELRNDRLGTRIYASSGGHFEIDNIANNSIGTLNAAYTPAVWIGGCHSIAQNVQYDTQLAASLLPLKPGTKTAIEASRGEQRWQLTFTVGQPEQISVTAGQYLTVPIIVEERSTVGNYHGETKCWFAPEVGFPVKRESRVIAGSNEGRLTEWQAIRVELKDRANKAEFVAPQIGVSYYTNINTYFQINRVDGTKVVTGATGSGQLLGGGLYSTTANDTEADNRDENFRRIWPLEKGKRASFSFARGMSAGSHTLVVEDTETISTPIGRLGTFRIVWTETNIQTGYKFVKRIWYSPGMRFIAKQEFEYPPQVKPPENWALQSVRLPPASQR